MVPLPSTFCGAGLLQRVAHTCLLTVPEQRDLQGWLGLLERAKGPRGAAWVGLGLLPNPGLLVFVKVVQLRLLLRSCSDRNRVWFCINRVRSCFY